MDENPTTIPNPLHGSKTIGSNLREENTDIMLTTFIKKQRDLFRQWRRELGYKFQYESPVRISPKTKLSKQSFVGRYSYMGIGVVFDDIHVGRYCSIADGFTIISGNHALNYLTTHPIYASNALFGWIDEYRDLDFKTKNMDTLHATVPPPLIIGHDVWMGNRVTLLGKVKSIGNGAVIGAGSVVTRDVPSYAIVAGNPAKILRYRFPKTIIKDLETLKWWDLPLSSIKHLNLADIEGCITELKKIRATRND